MSDKIEPISVPLPSGSVGRFLASIGNLSTCLGAIHRSLSQSHGLGERGVWMLSWISEGHGYPGYISKAMMLPPSVVSGDLKRLMDTGFVMKARSPDDARRIRYTLTPSGKSLLSKAHGLYLEALQDKIGSYPETEMRAFLRMLFEISLHARGVVQQDG